MSASTPSVLDRVIDGRYQVESEIAQGGMATVYRARDLRLDRPVALKVMRADLARDEAFVRRFVHEARAAARLQHQHVVSVYDQGEDDDVVFLAMELVEGPNLRDVINHRAPLTARMALTLVIPVVEALAEAHRRGLVHRDVKPENVLLADGHQSGVKVADFGLARAIPAAKQQATSEMLWGTAAYLAPEQVEHGTADARTDVYAVGLLLFELLSGSKAFPGGDPLRVAYEHVHGSVPSVRDLVPTVPARVDALIRRSAANDPDDRPQDGSALLQELRGLLLGLGADELDAVPADPRSDPDQTQLIASGGGAGSGDATQVVSGSTRRIPVARPHGDGSYARTTGNRTPPRRPRTPPRQAPAPAAPRRRRRAAGWIVGLLLLLGLGGGSAYGVWYYTQGPAVHSEMPVVVDLPEPEARALLDAAQLDPSVAYEYSEDVGAGLVLSADQEPGTSLRHGTDVQLVVSQGPERYAVPPLAGLTLESARDALESANLTLGEQTREHDEVEPEGRVLRSEPASGEPVPPATPVDIVLSDGPAPVDVPDVTGSSQQEAVQLLTRAGLTVTVDPERVSSEDVPEGSVVSQSPSSGTLDRGSNVTITISDGPELVTVPDVVRQQIGSAEEELTDLGLVVVREDVRGGFFGTVREQSIEPDTEVPVGTEIVLVVV